MRFIKMSASAIALVMPTAGLAQTAAPAVLDEIIVTAQRREQTITEVPLAISAFTGDALTEKGVTNSADLAMAVPNLQVNSPYGSTQPNFALRGISVANEYNSNQASPIGVYINDVYLANRTSHGMGLFDLERVEVLRGPQGTLFGRNTTGGAINFITRGPRLNGNEGYAEFGYGNFNTLTAQGAAEATLAEDHVGVRAAVNYKKGDGQIKNVYPGGRDPNSTDTLQGRFSLRVVPGDGDVDINLKAYAGRDRGTQAAVHGLLPYRQGLGFFEVKEDSIGDNRTDAWGTSANIAWNVSDSLSITSITSYDGGKQNLQQASDGSPLVVLNINWQSDYKQFNQELRANYGGDGYTLVAGGIYGRDTVETDNLFNIGSMLAPGVDGGFFQHYKQVRKSKALFGQVDYDLSDPLTLTVGARYTWDTSRYEDGTAYLFAGKFRGTPSPLATTVPCAGAAGTCAYNPNARFNLNGDGSALTGRVALSYKVEDGTLLYASYNRGYRSGAFNGGSYTSSKGINYVDPEKVNAYEIGAKGRYLDNRLSLSGALFYYDYRNQQVQDLQPGPTNILVNAPKSRVLGAEAEFNLRVSGTFSVNGSMGLLDTKYKELTLQGADLSGNELPFAPKLTAQLGFDWQVAELGEGAVTLSPTASYFSRQWFSPFNDVNPLATQANQELQQGGYMMVNANLAWERDGLRLSVFANNLFNTKAYGYGLDLRGAGFPYPFLVPKSPRTFGASLRYSF